MEELEDPTEKLREHVHEHAGEEKSNWSFYVALSTAFMAVFAAISGLIGADHANEAIMDQIKASNQWSYYQAKSIKAQIAATSYKAPAFTAVEQAESDKKVAKYEAEKEDIRKKAEEEEKSSEAHLTRHKVLARAVTMFQVAIALAAVSLLAKKRFMWAISIALALIGAVFLVQGLV